MIKIKIPLTPVPASRPRVTRWGVYYGKSHVQFVKDVQPFINKLVNPLEGIFKVDITYIIPLPKSTSKKNLDLKHDTFCEKNGDLDNLDKLVWDEIITGNFIKDDRFIVDGNHRKVWTRNSGCILIEIEELPIGDKLNIADDKD